MTTRTHPSIGKMRCRLDRSTRSALDRIHVQTKIPYVVIVRQAVKLLVDASYPHIQFPRE